MDAVEEYTSRINLKAELILQKRLTEKEIEEFLELAFDREPVTDYEVERLKFLKTKAQKRS